MDLRQRSRPLEIGCDSEAFLEMVSSPPFFVPVAIYAAKNQGDQYIIDAATPNRFPSYN